VAALTVFTFSGNAFSFDGANSIIINGTTNSSLQTIALENMPIILREIIQLCSFSNSFTTSAVEFNNNVVIGNGSTFGLHLHCLQLQTHLSTK
jgi:hypothetical protein